MMHVGWITDVQDTIDFYNAGTLDTGHVQFTEDQSGIPTGIPGFFADYNDILMPVETQGGVPMQARILDFIENGLTDPRVANEEFPFDRPTLRSESVGEPIPAASQWGFVVMILALLTAANIMLTDHRYADGLDQ